MKKKEKKSFYKVRQFRIDDEIYEWLLSEKIKNKGTWNYFFKKVKVNLTIKK